MPFVKGQARPSGSGRRKTAGLNGKLHIEYWPIQRLVPYEKNPRRNDGAVDRMVASIRQFGFAVPVLAQSTGEVVDGHLRLKAALKLHMTEVPVIVCDGWTEAQVKAFRLMVNRSVAWADWDFGALSLEFQDLKGLNFDLSLTGFEAFEIDADWSHWHANGDGTAKPEWAGMPEFAQEDCSAWKTIPVHFANEADLAEFGELIGQDVNEKTHFVWHPQVDRLPSRPTQHYAGTDPSNPKYPVYVISKGRFETRPTTNALEKMAVPYRIVVEPQEFGSYAAVIDPAKILVLPFSDLGQGSIPARNWVWEHSISEGHERHWILDDNIWNFYRFNKNLKSIVSDGSTFRASEDFTDRYTNVGLAGFQYEFFVARKEKHPPYTLNTRIYSCILVDNTLPFRWRGRYNEDTDISLRVLKAGLCTILFNAFLAKKTWTMKMKGGNTDELYQGDGRLEMAKSLQEQHPDVVTITQKWNRWQHQVNYKPFKNNKFIPKPGFTVPDEVNNYGMELERITSGA